MKRREFIALVGSAGAGLFAVHFPRATLAQDAADWVTAFPRAPIPVAAWPAGRKVAVSFALFVEEFGFGQGPVFRPDLAGRNPDLVNEAFRQYAIDWGIPRVGRLFKELDVPLSIVLNAEFPGRPASVWKEFRASQAKAPIIAHGMNNTSRMLPLGRGLAAQKAYVRETLDLIASATGVRPNGWSSPSVYSNGDTMQAVAAEGITYTIDQMDSDIISRLQTPDGSLVQLLSGRDGRHGTAARADEDARGDRDPVARLWSGAGARGPRRSRAGGDDGRYRNPSLCDRDARRGGGVAPGSLASDEGGPGLAHRHRRHSCGCAEIVAVAQRPVAALQGPAAMTHSGQHSGLALRATM